MRNLFRRKSDGKTGEDEPLMTAGRDRLIVLDILDLYLDPFVVPCPARVYRTDGEQDFRVKLPSPLNPLVESKDLYVKIRRNKARGDVVYLSMVEPSSVRYPLTSPERLYHWPTYIMPMYQTVPMVAVIEDSVEGRWLSMAMHLTFGQDHVAWRMKRSLGREEGEVIWDGPRPDGVFALGCENVWTLEDQQTQPGCSAFIVAKQEQPSAV